jgi:hypothetical protein
MSTLLHLTMGVNRASTDYQQSIYQASTEHQQSVNRSLTIMGVASCIIQGLCYSIYPKSTYWQRLWVQEKATWSQPQSENECQQSVNNFVCCILYYPRAALRYVSIIDILAARIRKIVNVDVSSPDNEHQPIINTASTERQQSINRASTEHQQSVNNLGSCIMYDSRTVQWHSATINV